MVKDWRFFLILLCFVLSGLAGLIYQNAWTQQFALVFGASDLAVATVLAAYMAGLMAGALVAGRFVDRIERLVLTYAVLELGIALSALSVPAALRLAGRLQVALFGGLEIPPEAGSLSSAIFYLISAFVILLVPTGLMGATLPLLARHAVVRDAEVGPRVGLLYSANTWGAMAGTLLAAFVLLARVGLGRTVLVAVATNVLVFLLAAVLARGARGGVVGRSAAGAKSLPKRARSVPLILPLMWLSGLVAFSWEVLWTRLLSHLLGGSVYAFGTMLATFLAGIGLGSAVAARLAADAGRARCAFAVVQLGVAVTSYAAFVAVDRLPHLARGLNAGSGALLLQTAPFAAATLLPSALFFGATFPLAVRILAGDAAAAGRASARVYVWNTFGAIAGAVLTGFFLLPALKIAGMATAAVGLSLVLALVSAWILSEKDRPRGRRLAVITAVAGLLALALIPPQTPWRVLRHAPIQGRQIQGEPAFYGVGRSSTVLVFEHDAEWRLTTNGLPESAIQSPGGRVGRFSIARWLSLLPVVSRPEMRSVLIVGLGAGLTLDAVPPTVEEIHLVELESEVVRANRTLAGVRRRDPLADPRLRLHINDARSALALSEQRYDAVVSQPSHPWTAGASHLFTHEFFTLVKERLEPEGVFVQWIGLQFVDDALLRSLLATLADVFPHVEVYEPPPGGAVLFLASRAPLAVEEGAALGIEAASAAWSRMGVEVPEDIFAARSLTSDGVRHLGEGAPITRDFHNLFKTRSPRILHDPLRSVGADALFADFDPLVGAELKKGHGLYYIRRLLRLRRIHRARRLAAALKDPADRQTATGLIHLAAGRRAQGEEALQGVFRRRPDADEAFYALLLANRQQLFLGRAPLLVARLEQDEVASLVFEGWRLLSVRNEEGVRPLEKRLAEIDPRHALYQTARRLQIAWRQATGEEALAREALELLEPLVAFGHQHGHGVLLRARLAVLARESDVALASLYELAAFLRAKNARVMAQEAWRIFESLPESARDDPRYGRLETDLRELIAPPGG